MQIALSTPYNGTSIGVSFTFAFVVVITTIYTIFANKDEETREMEQWHLKQTHKRKKKENEDEHKIIME